MGKIHHYDVTVSWTGETSSYRSYSRAHEVRAGGPPPLAGSSDPFYRGDKDRWNPEQLFVAALSQCHMLSYLHLCAVGGVVVTSYEDTAHGEMDGTRMTSVVLHPRVTVTDESMLERAQALHDEAHEICFIANSVSVPVTHRAESSAAGRSASSSP